ncbi:uncharacterized protein F4812DRAFT_467364 [Daldinia caldariorum]|uniref:uncharacterized protein n=1 Tax=Daldinia caldariorum TaxID=326644 RepID=UPI002007832F|nr:uncharacterized protein F4812DRAFT_467364 [Daldinia caldariorum]KAI1471179.1 hypothetical protein F4812DRAFT_467364 [Daldinia caldariorum]
MGLSTDWVAAVVVSIATTAYMAFVDIHIVQRRDTIVQCGRQAQRKLHVPKCIHIFSETDPGILKKNLEGTALCLGFACVFNLFGMAAAFILGTLWDPLAFGLGIVFPDCIVLAVWLGLVLARRKMDRGNFKDDREDLESKGVPAPVVEGWSPARSGTTTPKSTWRTPTTPHHTTPGLSTSVHVFTPTAP